MDYQKKAVQLRIDTVKALHGAKSGHPGGSLSEVEILMALYYHTLKVDPKNPRWDGRDRFVLSKGHANPALYAVLADLGFFPKEELDKLRKVDGHLQGHPDMHKTPGIDMSTGSLGQGMAVAAGMALSAKVQGKDYQVYTLVGDGEIQEGIAWECAMSAAHYKLDNYTIIVDHNGLQIDGSNDEVMSLGDIPAKYRAFGFDVIQVDDGNDYEKMCAALDVPHTPGKPKCIIAETVKGKGVSFMENNADWHGKGIDDESYAKAMAELEAKL